jgi:hypothetical protein
VNRQAALVLGDRTYEGKRCKRCSRTVRYTKGSNCVHCQKETMIEARALLRAARLHSPLLLPEENKIEVPAVILEPRKEYNETAVPRAGVPTTGDPEPICPSCGCGVEADHDEIDGWLRRVSPWACTICDWIDPAPPPPAVDLDFLS